MIRDEHPGDEAAIRDIHRRAFGEEGEGRLVDRLRADGLVVASIVAVDGEEIVGHVLFSELPIEHDGGTVHAVALAPVGVRPDYQRQGIGSALIERGLERCRERGIDAVIVLGDPAYYGRFGFSGELAQGIASPYACPAFQALELTPGALAGGTARYPDAFRLVD
jgi:putative acetyltransferase